MYCPNCQALIGSKARYCPHCSHSVVVSSQYAPQPKFASSSGRITWLIAAVCVLIAGLISYSLFKQVLAVRLNYSVADTSAELCDRAAILSRCDTLIQRNKSRACIELSNQFFAGCGDYDQLHRYRNAAARRLSEWGIALESANALLAHNPLDADAYYQRASTYDEKDDSLAAIADYEQALALMPGAIQAPFALANLNQKTGQPCRGLGPLEQYRYLHPDYVDNADTLIEQLSKNPQCSELHGKGQARIKMDARHSAINTQATFNGALSGHFVIDTGATVVTLSKKFADKLNLNYANWPQRLSQTANGKVQVRYGHVDSITLMSLQAKHVEVAVMPNNALGNIDGLLGLSFLNRFKIELNARQGVMTLSEKH